jgi:hypothetical protein
MPIFCGASSSEFLSARKLSHATEGGDSLLQREAVLSDIQNRVLTPILTLPQNNRGRESEV